MVIGDIIVGRSSTVVLDLYKGIVRIITKIPRCLEICYYVYLLLIYLFSQTLLTILTILKTLTILINFDDSDDFDSFDKPDSPGRLEDSTNTQAVQRRRHQSLHLLLDCRPYSVPNLV